MEGFTISTDAIKKIKSFIDILNNEDTCVQDLIKNLNELKNKIDSNIVQEINDYTTKISLKINEIKTLLDEELERQKEGVIIICHTEEGGINQ